MPHSAENLRKNADGGSAVTWFDDWGDGWGGTRRKTGPTNTLYMLADELDEIHGYWPKSVPPPGPDMDKLLSDPTVPKWDEEREGEPRHPRQVAGALSGFPSDRISAKRGV